jgi:hypothetical protein
VLFSLPALREMTRFIFSREHCKTLSGIEQYLQVTPPKKSATPSYVTRTCFECLICAVFYLVKFITKVGIAMVLFFLFT